MSHRTKLLLTSIVILIITIIWLIRTMDQHFNQMLDGFWVFDEVDSKCILYIDSQANMMRVIAISDGAKPINEKISITLDSQTWIDMYLRRYSFTGVNSSPASKYSKILAKSGLYFDLYPTEGTMIINNKNGDIMTLIKDHGLGQELLL